MIQTFRPAREVH
jgi:hypothetical protein